MYTSQIVQYITISQVLEQKDMNNEQTQLLLLSNNKNNWFGLYYALLDKDFNNKIYFENKNIKTFHHTF